MTLSAICLFWLATTGWHESAREEFYLPVPQDQQEQQTGDAESGADASASEEGHPENPVAFATRLQAVIDDADREALSGLIYRPDPAEGGIPDQRKSAILKTFLGARDNRLTGISVKELPSGRVDRSSRKTLDDGTLLVL